MRKELIGTWAYAKDPASKDIFFFAQDYYVFIRPYKNINYKGEEPLLYYPPSKYAYRIGKNFNYLYALLPSLLTDLAFRANSAFGSYYAKSPYPVKIVESLFDDSITLENNDHTFHKLKESEVLELLKDYDIDYELLAKEKIKGANLGNLIGAK